MLLQLACQHRGTNWETRKVPDYSFLADIMETTAPEAKSMPQLLLGMIQTYLMPEAPDLVVAQPAENARVQLFTRLAGSSRRTHVLLGKLGLLAGTFCRTPRKDIAPLSSIRDQLASLERDYADVVEKTPEVRRLFEAFRRQIGSRNQAGASTAPASAPAVSQGPDLYLSRVFYKPVPLQFRIPPALREKAAAWKHDNEVKDEGTRFCQCGPMDVVWKLGLLALQREPGVLDAIDYDAGAEFQDAVWDGQHAWQYEQEDMLWQILIDRPSPFSRPAS
jgi:hypothetical protein